MTSSGPRSPIEGPLLVPPPRQYSILAFEVPPGDERWGNGASFEPESCGGDVQTFEIDCNHTIDKGDGERSEVVDLDPFAVVAVDECSTLGGRSLADYQARARRKLEACQAFQIEQEFWTGTKVSTNPHLDEEGSTDLTPVAGGLEGWEALALLEDELGRCSCGFGVIHMTRKMFTVLSHQEVVEREPNGYFTALGTRVIAGAGYTGSAPGGSVPAGATEYMYATGPIQVRMGAVFTFPSSMTEAVDRSVNTARFYAERPAMVNFDSCCHLSVSADVPGLQGS